MPARRIANAERIESRALLARVIQTLRITQTQLARRLGLSHRSSISHMLSGRSEVTPNITTRLRQLLVEFEAERSLRVLADTGTLTVDTDHSNTLTASEYYQHLPYCAQCLAQAYAQRGGQRTVRAGIPHSVTREGPEIHVHVDTEDVQRDLTHLSEQIQHVNESATAYNEAVRRSQQILRELEPPAARTRRTRVQPTAAAPAPVAATVATDSTRTWLGEIEDE